MKQNKRKIFNLILAFLIFLNLFSFLLENKEPFSLPYDADYWRSRYEESQWAKGYEAGRPMGDVDLYAYAGWRQIQGDDPTLINAEQPPTGKYLVGLSILLFNNQNIIGLILGIAVLMITFLLARQLLKETSWALLAVWLLSLDQLFKEDLIISMLDLPFTFFISLSFLFLLLAEEKKILFLPAMIFLSLATSTKMYLAGFGLLAALSIFMIFMAVLKKKKDFLCFFLFLPFFALGYLGSYLVYFIKGHNLWDFKYLHFWIRHFARVRFEGYPKGEIFKILLLGRWLTWWGEFNSVKVKQWSLFWPFSFAASLFLFLRALAKKNYPLLLLLTWVFSFLIMYSFGVPYPRYLLSILPALYLILVYSFRILIERKK